MASATNKMHTAILVVRTYNRNVLLSSYHYFRYCYNYGIEIVVVSCHSNWVMLPVASNFSTDQ